jgi:hypothetical protein
MLKISASYGALLKRVRQTLIEGQERIEAERVRTYWETGRLIHGHILQNKDRADYGSKTVANLARDLKVSSRHLQQCVQFAKEYESLPIAHARAQLGWTHFRQLMSVPEAKKRAHLEAAVGRNGWSTKELAQQIKLGRDARSKEDPAPSKKIPPQTLLTPLRGELYTYRIVTRPTVGAGEDSGLLVDLGFGIFRECESRGVSEGEIVRSSKRDDDYRLTKIEATAAQLFTYAGYVERVIDGDTLKVRLDLGFGMFSRHDLRLRGIDCPEMAAKAGQEAKVFAQSYIKEAQRIIARSSRSDKYDRYLADVFLPAEDGKDIYLNNLLLASGHAVRV